MTIPFLRLVCKNCSIIADMRVDADDKTNWPLHRCGKTNKAEPFSTVIGVPKPPVSLWATEEAKKPPQPQRDHSYLRSIG